MMDTCDRCARTFDCTSDTSCWCLDIPNVLTMDAHIFCLCPACLSNRIKDFFLANPNQAGFYFPKDKKAYKAGKVEIGIDYTINGAGNWVFTGYFHLKRGYCCQNGRLNCPYGYKKSNRL